MRKIRLGAGSGWALGPADGILLFYQDCFGTACLVITSQQLKLDTIEYVLKSKLWKIEIRLTY